VELIRTALDEDRMLLYCQPILDLKDREVCQYELLLRLVTDRRIGATPAQLVPVRGRTLQPDPGDRQLGGQESHRPDRGVRAGRPAPDPPSQPLGKSVGDARVATLIEEGISEAGIDPTCLVFELTETTAITSIEDATTFVHRLHARGCRLALDDFGAGFGSFYYLKSLPFDYFKIDGDFIRGLVGSPMDQLVVQAIVGSPGEWARRPLPSSCPTRIPAACSRRAASIARRAITSVHPGP
jgi:predicted signal transduction protein with EAL and GGDEF domain